MLSLLGPWDAWITNSDRVFTHENLEYWRITRKHIETIGAIFNQIQSDLLFNLVAKNFIRNKSKNDFNKELPPLNRRFIDARRMVDVASYTNQYANFDMLLYYRKYMFFS